MTDPKTPEKRKRGRPPTGAAKAHLSLRIPAHLRDKLSDLAEASGQTVTEVATGLLLQALDK